MKPAAQRLLDAAERVGYLHPNREWVEHRHLVPGVWDADNGPIAGKPCAACRTWIEFLDSLAAYRKEKADDTEAKRLLQEWRDTRNDEEED